MVRRKPWLVADQNHGRVSIRFQAQQSFDSSVNRTGNSLLPVRIYNNPHTAEIHSFRNALPVRAKQDQHRIGTSLADDADRPCQERFAGNTHQLLGLAEAAAGSSGKKDGRHRHEFQFSPGPFSVWAGSQFALDLPVPKLETEDSRRTNLA